MFEWDEEKRLANLAKHRVDLSEVWDCDWSKALCLTDERIEYGENRMIAFVPLKKRLHVCVYTMRGEVMRVISLRKANLKERKRYEYTMDNA